MGSELALSQHSADLSNFFPQTPKPWPWCRLSKACQSPGSAGATEVEGLLIHSEASDTQISPSPGYQGHLVLGTVHKAGAGRTLLERNPKEAGEELSSQLASPSICAPLRPCRTQPNIFALCGRPKLPQGLQLHRTKFL